MATLKFIKSLFKYLITIIIGAMMLIALVVLYLLFFTKDEIKSINNQNFNAIIILDYPDTLNANIKLSFYEKDSKFLKKEVDYYHFEKYPYSFNEKKGIEIICKFDNSFDIEGDMQLSINDTLYYYFRNIKIEYDTIRKSNILNKKMYIYKKMSTIVNDSTMYFNEYNHPYYHKRIVLPFSLARYKKK